MENFLFIFIESYGLLDQECECVLSRIHKIESRVLDWIPPQNIKKYQTQIIKKVNLIKRHKTNCYPFRASSLSCKANNELKKVVSRVHDKDSLYRKIKA